MLDLVIATVIAVVFVGIATWVGDWSGARNERRVDAYWTACGPKDCPACGNPYDDASRQETCSTFGGPGGCDFTCHACGESAFFSYREDGVATFVSFDPQWRLCQHCGEENKATPDMLCHTCGNPVGRTALTRSENAAD